MTISTAARAPERAPRPGVRPAAASVQVPAQRVPGQHRTIPGSRLSVTLVEDHRLLAQSLSLALQLEGVTCLVPDLDDREALLVQILAGPTDLVLLDLDLGAAIGDGSTLVDPLVRAGRRVLLVTASTDSDRVGAALEQGAVGAVPKSAPFDQLLASVLRAARGEDLMEPAERQAVLQAARGHRLRRATALAPFARLSGREAQVLRALARGQGVAAIAAAWFVSEATVRSQVRAILTKLAVTSQLEAVAAAHHSGWLHD